MTMITSNRQQHDQVKSRTNNNSNCSQFTLGAIVGVKVKVLRKQVILKCV